MKIFQIDSTGIIKQNGYSFKGIVGKKQLINTDGLHYKIPYYPFKDEDKLSIHKNLLKNTYSEPVDNENSVRWEYEAYVAAILPILTAEYELFKKSPKSISKGKRNFIEKVIKTMVK